MPVSKKKDNMINTVRSYLNIPGEKAIDSYNELMSYLTKATPIPAQPPYSQGQEQEQNDSFLVPGQTMIDRVIAGKNKKLYDRQYIQMKKQGLVD